MNILSHIDLEMYLDIIISEYSISNIDSRYKIIMHNFKHCTDFLYL